METLEEIRVDVARIYSDHLTRCQHRDVLPLHTARCKRLSRSGPRSRTQANLAALEVLRQLDAEQRLATRAEEQVLAGWSSWGALPKVFDDPERESLASRGAGVWEGWAFSYPIFAWPVR